MTDDRALAEAIRRHEERLARDPESLAFAQLADLYRKAGRTGDAIALCREGLHRWPHYTTARLILAKTLLAEGQLDARAGRGGGDSPDEPEGRTMSPAGRRGPSPRGPPRRGGGAPREGGRPRSRRPGVATRCSRCCAPTRPRPESAAGLARVLGDDTFVTLSFGTLCLEQGLADEAALVLHPDRPEGPGQRRGARAAGSRAARPLTTERVRSHAGVDRGVQEGAADRLRRAAVRDRRLPARQAGQGRRLRAHQAQAHAAGQGDRQHVPLRREGRAGRLRREAHAVPLQGRPLQLHGHRDVRAGLAVGRRGRRRPRLPQGEHRGRRALHRRLADRRSRCRTSSS